MYCPACSSQAKPEQKFCRACGLSLEGLTERVAAHQGLPVAKNKEGGTLAKVGIGVATSGIGLLALTVVFALLSMAFRLMPEREIGLIAPGLFAIGFTLIVFGSGAMVISKFLQKENISKQKLSPPLPTIVTNELSPSAPPLPLSSVTDATTRNLEPVMREGSLPQDKLSGGFLRQSRKSDQA